MNQNIFGMCSFSLAVIIWSAFQGSTQGVSIHGEMEKRLPRQSMTTFESGIGCGTIRVNPDHVIQVQSNNFLKGNYFNNDACTWTFTAKDCDLSVHCPCFDIPSSFGCLEDYLKIGYHAYYDRFCGENPPVGVYRATSDYLTLKFRSDYKTNGKGFMCYVRCTKAGSADPVITDYKCPANGANPFGNPPVKV